MFEIGGSPVVIKELIRERLHATASCPTVTGRTLAQAVAMRRAPDGEVVRSCDRAAQPDGGLVVLSGNLCPDGAV